MNTGRMRRVLVTLVAWVAAVGWLGMAHAQPMPKDYDPGKNRAAERAAAEQAAAAKQKAEAERQRREAAEAKAADAESRAAELKRQLAESKRKVEDAQKQAGEAQKKVGAGDTAAAPTMQSTREAPTSYAALTVFRDMLSDGTQGPEMIVIPAGSFEMGSNDGDAGEKPGHTVHIAKAFALGKTEVTQAQWRQVMGDSPSHFKGCEICPVENISWDDVQDFIRKLSVLTGKTYRLPSEAEWEYAARADGNSTYGGGKDFYAVAWDANERVAKKTIPVGQTKPNAWGLYDMSGNVWELMEDVWHDNYQGAPTDGSAWVTGGEAGRRVLRGGSWLNFTSVARAVDRGRSGATNQYGDSGFRLARTLP